MPLPASPARPSTKHRVVDAEFAAALEEDFGIPTAFVLRTLKKETRQRAVALCRLATRYEERNGTLLMLTRKFGRGRACRQRTPGTAPRRHGRVSPRPFVDRPGPRLGQDTAAPRGVALEVLETLVERLWV